MPRVRVSPDPVVSWVLRDGFWTLVARCPVCRREVVMERLGRGLFQVLMHQFRGEICNGTGRRALLARVPVPQGR